MVYLKVNFTADVLVIKGPATGTRYEYRPGKDNGKMEVDATDVEGLKSIIRKEGCRCNNKDGSVDVRFIEYHLFEDLS